MENWHLFFGSVTTLTNCNNESWRGNEKYKGLELNLDETRVRLAWLRLTLTQPLKCQTQLGHSSCKLSNFKLLESSYLVKWLQSHSTVCELNALPVIRGLLDLVIHEKSSSLIFFQLFDWRSWRWLRWNFTCLKLSSWNYLAEFQQTRFVFSVMAGFWGTRFIIVD